MHTLAFVNQKGGCGKTTAAIHLAGALGIQGQRVLLVDLDPQAHATLGLGRAVVEGEPSLADVLNGTASIARAVQRAPASIHLVPAVPELAAFEEEAAQRLRPERVLREALAVVADDYDFALLDCPAHAHGVLAANALRAADTALLVVECGAFALQGALQALRILEETTETLEWSFETRMLATLLDRNTRIGRELLIAMQTRFGELLFDTAIRTSVRLREAAAYGLPVQVLDPQSRSARDFQFLAEEVLEHAGRRAPAAPRVASPRPSVSSPS